MNKVNVIGICILLFVIIFSTSCFASTEGLDVYEINETIPIEEAEDYEKNIQKNLFIDNNEYELQNVTKQENTNTISEKRKRIEQKIVYSKDKYEVLKMFGSKINLTENNMTGTLELQNDTLNIKTNDSYTEEYKVYLTKEYNNVPTNELVNIPKIIKENGTTYYLTNPVWTVSKVEKIEGQDIPVEYSGKMNYEGIKERTIVKNYLATVEYEGTIEREEVESITFKASYRKINKENFNYVPIIATAGSGIVIVSGIILFKRKRKNKIK